VWHTVFDWLTQFPIYGGGMPSAPFRPDPQCLADPSWAADHPQMCRAYYQMPGGLVGPRGGGGGRGFLGGLLGGLTGGLL